MFLVSSANADTVVSWGTATDIVTGHTSLQAAGRYETAVNFGAGLSSPTSAGYYPNDTGKTKEFYAAAYGEQEWDVLPASFGVDYRVANDYGGGNDYLNSGYGTSDNTISRNDVWYTYIWTSDEFMTDGGTPTGFELTGMQAVMSDNGGAVNSDFHFVIQLADSNWYASEVYDEGNRSFTDPTAVSWYNYDPTVDFRSIGSLASLTASDFEDLTAAGLYATSFSGANQYVVSRVYEFNVSATAIPEPSAVALMGLAGLAVMFCFCKRRRK